MERRKMFLKMLIAAMIIFSANAHAIWSPDWQVEFTDELDSGGVVLKDKYAIGAGAADGYLLTEDIYKVKLPGWPDSGYSGPVAEYICMSSTAGAVELARDARSTLSWDIDLSASAVVSGTQTISWVMSGVPGDVNLSLIDYGTDSSRTTEVASTALNSASSSPFSVTTSAGVYRYMRVAVSVTQITAAIVQSGGNAYIEWEGSASSTYAVVYADDLSGSWSVLPGHENIAGSDGTMSAGPLDTSMGKRFYKVVALD
jgi:hypothetical protein